MKSAKAAHKPDSLSPSPIKRDISPSPSAASKVSTISRLSARFGAFKHKDKKATAEVEENKKKSPKSSKKKNKKRASVPSESSTDRQLVVALDDSSSPAANPAAPVPVVAAPPVSPVAGGGDADGVVRAKAKAATLERSNNLSDAVRQKSPGSRPWKRLNRQKILPKLIGKRNADSKAVAVESTDLDMRTAASPVRNGGNDRLDQETEEGRAVAAEATVDCWSTQATNQKVMLHMQSTMEYDSDENENRRRRDNGADDPGPTVNGNGSIDKSRRAPLARQESSAATTTTGESELEDGGAASVSSQNGNLHITKKSPSEIRQEILSRTAPRPRRISDIVSPTFQPKADNFSRQMSLQQQAKNVDNKKELLCKILVIGELGTGKTSIIKRYVHQFFSQHYRATIGVDFALKVLAWDADTTIRLQLWDIAGQERFGNMTRVYYKEAHGAFIVFDVTRLATFEAVVKWKQDLDSKVQLSDGSPVPCVLLANKCDQPKEGIVNHHSKMDEYCKENNFVSWFETSAKDNINIDQAANCLVTKILQNEERKEAKDANNSSAGVFPLDNSLDEKKKSCAC